MTSRVRIIAPTHETASEPKLSRPRAQSFAPKVGSFVDTCGMLGAATVILLRLYLFARLISVAACPNAALRREHAGSMIPAKSSSCP